MEKEVLSVEALQAMRGKLAQEISASASDFVETYEATSSAYFCDAFQEFADSQTSIYYADQRRYYEEHTSACEDALTELYDPDYLADIIKKEGLEGLLCKAGAVGEYQSIENDLYNDFEKIKSILALDYIIENKLQATKIDMLSLDIELQVVDNNDYISDVEEAVKTVLASEE